MRFLQGVLFALLAWVSVRAGVGPQEFPCTFVSSAGDYYDLSPLSVCDESGYSVSGDEGFQINICNEVYAGSCRGDAAVCQANTWTTGSVQHASFSSLPSGGKGLVLTYSGGDQANGCPNAGNRSSVLTFTCSTSATTPVFTFVNESPTCTYNFAVSSAYACPVVPEPTCGVPCSYYSSSSGAYYDLSPLTLCNGNTYSASGDGNFVINVCGKVNSQCGNSNAAICQGEYYSTGDVTNITFSALPGGAQGVVLRYGSGDGGCPDGIRSSVISFECALSVDPPVFTFINESPQCQYNFQATSKYACPLQQLKTQTTCTTMDPNWVLQWHDEFDGSTIDATKWNVRNQDGNEGNGESQYYLPSQVFVQNGYLNIVSNNVTSNNKPYISGWVDTHNLFSATYGRFEFRAQMPGGATDATGAGLWPALWTLSQDTCWPQGWEYDIMEYRGILSNLAQGNLHYANETTTCGSSELSFETTYAYSQSFGLAFHIFVLELFPNNATWYVDGIRFLTVTSSQLVGGKFDPTPHYIIMNTAIGGPGWDGQTDKKTTVYPTTMLIDYVRFYAYRGSCNANSCSGHGCCNTTTLLCNCSVGWAGTNCEYWAGYFVDYFQSTNIQYTPATDVAVNGWGNGVTLYLAPNMVINKVLTLSLTDAGCPSLCGNLPYSGGGWNSAQSYSYGTFSFYAKSTNVPGTGFSVGAAGTSAGGLMEQILFQFTGANTSEVVLYTWHSNYQYEQKAVSLSNIPDFSAAYHNYSFVYMPTSVQFSIDGTVVCTTETVIPTGPLTLGIYYSAQPTWYGGTFTYTGVTTTTVKQANWLAANIPATC